VLSTEEPIYPSRSQVYCGCMTDQTERSRKKAKYGTTR